MPRKRKADWEHAFEAGERMASAFDEPRRKRRRKPSRGRSSEVDPVAAVVMLLMGGVAVLLNSLGLNSTAAIPICIGALVIAVIVLLFVRAHKQRREREAEAARQAQLATAWQRAMGTLFPQRAVELLPKSPRELDATKLEHLAQQVYAALGYKAEHWGGAGDGGIDVKLTAPDGGVFIVQCKQYQAKLQPNKVREVRGTLRGAQRGIIWAPGGYTQAAWEEAERKPALEALDETAIMDLVEEAYPASPALAEASPQTAMPPVTSPAAPVVAKPLPLGFSKQQWLIVAGLAAVIVCLGLILIALFMGAIRL